MAKRILFDPCGNETAMNRIENALKRVIRKAIGAVHRGVISA